MRRSVSRDIRQTLFLKASPNRIYRALTSARELCAWWVESAETDARNRGRLRMVWPAANGRSSQAEGVFVDLERGKKVAWIWKPRSLPRGVPPLVSFFITRQGRGCEVLLSHAGFSAAKALDSKYRKCRAGWEDCLAKLKLYLEKGRACKDERLSLADAVKPRAKR